MSKTYSDICSSDENPKKNTGFKDNCIESKLSIPVISNGFAFDDIADFKDVASWRAAIAAKSIVPLFPVYELADASTEDTLFESGNFSKVTSKGTEIITFECYLSVAAYAALKSYEELGNYGELFEFNEEGDYSGIFASDGTKVKGRKITSMEVTRIRATKEKVPFVRGRIVFSDKDDVLGAVLVESDLEDGNLQGIFDLDLESVSSSSSSIKFKVKSGGTLVNSLEDGDLLVKDSAGDTQVISTVTPGADGIYEVTGTGFETGSTLEINGVITQSTIIFEGVEPMPITITV